MKKDSDTIGHLPSKPPHLGLSSMYCTGGSSNPTSMSVVERSLLIPLSLDTRPGFLPSPVEKSDFEPSGVVSCA
eukprot:CAMPEP_0197176306 /NCGR_PEP_ID=MMETSP1423-20130617/2282_1 /TAXON_ID=476441 /ORGANISM="Pseudo-nitzschia heimii, Strain UNC1101" /LENGTH=73 /DNA_ID=CAMNT_0042625671 /DNA_START=594 /DNA_END=815 /DNA_ORIENTATION=+